MGDCKEESLFYLRKTFNIHFNNQEWFLSPWGYLDLGNCWVKVIIRTSHFFIGGLASHLYKIPSPLVFFLWSFRLVSSALFVVILVVGHRICLCQIFINLVIVVELLCCLSWRLSSIFLGLEEIPPFIWQYFTSTSKVTTPVEVESPFDHSTPF